MAPRMYTNGTQNIHKNNQVPDYFTLTYRGSMFDGTFGKNKAVRHISGCALVVYEHMRSNLICSISDGFNNWSHVSRMHRELVSSIHSFQLPTSPNQGNRKSET
jgi:hypothetical protein